MRVPDRPLSLITIDPSSIRVPRLLDTTIRQDTNAARRLEGRSRSSRSKAASGASLFDQNFLFMRAARGVIVRDELETGLNLRSILRPGARRPIALELVNVIITDSEQSGVGIKEIEFDAATRGERPDFLFSDVPLVEAERRRLLVRVRQPSVKQGARRKLLELIFWLGAGERRLGVDALAQEPDWVSEQFIEGVLLSHAIRPGCRHALPEHPWVGKHRFIV